MTDPRDDSNAPGICEYLGCGGQTLIATYTAPHRGITQGQPLRFCPEHYRPGRNHVEITYAVEDCGYTDPETGGPSACHVYGRKPRRGEYGAIGGRSRLVHVVAWEEVNGPLPEGFVLDHMCEIKLCVNPRHLALRTRADHAARHAVDRIPAEAVAGILDALRAATLSKAKIAAQFGVSRSYVFRLKNRHGL